MSRTFEITCKIDVDDEREVEDFIDHLFMKGAYDVDDLEVESEPPAIRPHGGQKKPKP